MVLSNSRWSNRRLKETISTKQWDSDVYMDLIILNIQQTNWRRQKSNSVEFDIASSNQHDMTRTRSVCCTKMRAKIKQLDSHACDDLIDSSLTLSPSLYLPIVVRMQHQYIPSSWQRHCCFMRWIVGYCWHQNHSSLPNYVWRRMMMICFN